MRFVGIDLSLTRTALTIFDPRKPVDDPHRVVSGFFGSKNAGEAMFVRQSAIISRIGMLLRREDVVNVEDFSSVNFGQGKSGKLVERIELLGMTKLIIPRLTGFPFLVTAQGNLKKFGTLRGNATKPEIVRAVKGFWGYPARNDDIADSFILAVLGFFGLRFPMCRPFYPNPVETVELCRLRIEEVRRFRALNLPGLRRIHFLSGRSGAKES